MMLIFLVQFKTTQNVSDVSALSVTPVNDFHGIWMMKRNQSTVRSAFYNLDYCVRFLFIFILTSSVYVRL